MLRTLYHGGRRNRCVMVPNLVVEIIFRCNMVNILNHLGQEQYLKLQKHT